MITILKISHAYLHIAVKHTALSVELDPPCHLIS